MEWIQNIYLPSNLKQKKKGISEGCTEVKKDSKAIQGRHKTQETQGGLACCDSWGRKESDTTERLN